MKVKKTRIRRRIKNFIDLSWRKDRVVQKTIHSTVILGLVRGKDSYLVTESFSVNMARSVLMRKLRCRSPVTQHKLTLANEHDCTHTGSASSVSQELTYYELTEIGQSFSENNCYLAVQFPHILFFL